ncbi:MAG TPA: 23S rRNA (adenine(2503)-C(2))-methyltransferase RlmN [Kofleriaceae bacterium]|nr:23S rRNA (adenine(2503)-C(2))-methyltransferase RlmN [Kofleriaceae bacterium]
MAERVDLRGLTFAETEALVEALGEKRYRGAQIFGWVHGHGVAAIDDMKNLPLAFRKALGERAMIATHQVAEVQTSRDGTRKMRLETADGKSIESVLIPDGEKLTQCISSQVGCALGCAFCATAKLGLSRHLSAGEIVDQVYRARALLAEAEPGRRITNIVYMGMGEPLHNYNQVVQSLRILTDERGANLSQRRITVSTVGLVPAIARLGQESVRPNLAISLNATTDDIRGRIMPINRRYPLAELLAQVAAYPLERRRRITFEYVLLAGENDSLDDAARLAKLMRPLRAKVNVIPWNPHPEAPYRRPSPEAIAAFQNELRRRGVAVYLRTPRGDDIDAACGQLANRHREAS